MVSGLALLFGRRSSKDPDHEAGSRSARAIGARPTADSVGSAQSVVAETARAASTLGHEMGDRAGAAAGRNAWPFLVQTYRRDMRGGVFAIMKEVDSPITIEGEHWGNVRLAYRLSSS